MMILRKIKTLKKLGKSTKKAECIILSSYVSFGAPVKFPSVCRHKTPLLDGPSLHVTYAEFTNTLLS